MRKNIDLGFGWLMILGCCGHTLGTIKGYPALSAIWVWSLGTSLAGFLLGAVNILRASRTPDKALGAISLAGAVGFALTAIGFGISIHDMTNFRVVINLVVTTALMGFSIATLAYPGLTYHRLVDPF